MEAGTIRPSPGGAHGRAVFERPAGSFMTGREDMEELPMNGTRSGSLRPTWRGAQSGAALSYEERRKWFPEPQSRAWPEDDRVTGETWAVILAGGEGTRLRSFTTSREGATTPKQFCRFRDERSLLSVTLDRALRITSPERVLAVVMDAHRRWWEREFDRLPEHNVIAQPRSRGTAVAILQALVEVHGRDRQPRLVVMPCDADVDDEELLLGSISMAQRTAWAFPDDVILLGVVPSHLDCEYGWIVPAANGPASARRVRAFVEKPSLDLARRLARQGGLWNSFIFACHGWALYSLFEEALPELAADYLHRLEQCGGGPAGRALATFDVAERDFGRDVLERDPSRLRLVPVPPCGWTDLGTPARLASWLERHRDAIFWREHELRRLGGGEMPGGAISPA